MKPATNFGTKLALVAVVAALPVYPELATGERGAAPTATALALAPQPQQDSVKRVGKRLMCLCGCNQVLVECNHVGCSMSSAMIKKLETRVAANEADDLILQAFVQEYGQRALAEPPAKGFNLAAWIMPLFALVAGSIIVAIALTRMKRPVASPAGAVGTRVSTDALERLRSQADRESEE